MFPLDIEEHDALNVDEYRLPMIVDENVIRPQFAVDEAVLRAWCHGGVPLPQRVREALLNGRKPVDTGCGCGQVVECAVQHNVLPWGDARPAARTRAPIPVASVAVHRLDSLTEASQHRFGALRVTFPQTVKCAAAHILKHGDLARDESPTPVDHVNRGTLTPISDNAVCAVRNRPRPVAWPNSPSGS